MKLHILPNSHIDPVWLWNKFEGIDEVLNTFRSACNRLDEYPTATFVGSSLQFYEWVLQHDEPLFARIQQFVKQGRWEVVGGWWVEADVNHPLGLSFVKHAEISRKFSLEHFGVATPVAYVPDCFGMPEGLPAVLADTGFKYFLFSRPDTKERGDVPNLCRWTYKGNGVIAYRLKNHYTQSGDLERMHLHILNDPEYPVGPVNAYAIGVGDHGGGPTKKELDRMVQIIKDNPTREIGFSTCQKFFEEAAATCTIPEFSGHLQHHAIGCYSVVRKVKDGVRSSEGALAVATRALAMDGKTSDSLEPLWKTTLFNQFHDILPGSCLGAAADHAANELGGALAGAQEAAYHALKDVSRKDPRPPMAVEGEFRIFNTLPYPITVPIDLQSFQYYQQKAAFKDQNGNIIEIQEVLQSVRAGQRRWEFIARLPASGFNSYWFDNATLVERPGFIHARYVPAESIENESVRILADGRLYLKQGNASVTPLTLGPARFMIAADCSDTWGHDVKRYADIVDEFKLVSSNALTGPITSKLHQKFTCHRSTIEMTYSLYRDLPRIYVDVKVNWSEYRQILKLQWKFPGPTQYVEVPMEGAGGPVIGNGGGNEMPLHRWAWFPTAPTAIGFLQKGAFACDWMNGRLRITLVRSSIYGMHTPAHEMDPDDPEIQTDQGEHSFRFCILLGAANDASELTRAADAFLEPCITIRES
jgi:alpha-mannosidase